MATTKRRDKVRGKQEEIKTNQRTQLMKDAQEYWKTLQKKWGAKDVALRFSMGNRNAGEYFAKDGKKGAAVNLFIPGVKSWTQARGTTTLGEAKRIMRHEMAHHRQSIKEFSGKEGVGRNPDAHSEDQETRWHGPNFKKQNKQIGGGRDLRLPATKKLGPPKPRPKAKASRKNRARKPPIRLGPPKDRKGGIDRGQRLPPRWRRWESQL